MFGIGTTMEVESAEGNHRIVCSVRCCNGSEYG
jgi:hypothetical protein